MEINIVNIKGEDTGKKAVLNHSIFGLEKPSDYAITFDVKHYLASIRQGTHKTKTRSQVKGSTRKIKRQKGTGTARAGDIKSPIFKGGGIVFGPIPKDHSFKINKKLKRLAQKSALSIKYKNNEIIVIEDFKFDEPKTKNIITMLNNLKINNKKTLLIIPEKDRNIYLSARNLKNFDIITPDQLTTYKLLNCSVVLLAESALEQINKLQ